SIILWFSLSIFLFSANVFFISGGPDRRRAQCNDPITPSTQSNLLCAVQGSLLIFASHALCYWCSFLIINLHLVTVWNKNFFSDATYPYVHLFCWGLPLVFTGAALGLKAVRYEVGSLCLMSSDWADELFFGPLAAVVGVAFLVHGVTVGYIVKIAMMVKSSAGPSSGFSGRSTVSSAGNGVAVANEEGSVGTRRRVMT
ncbi:hypothetical protein HDU67_005839, partial [Dinochytrium kinnereticum]